RQLLALTHIALLGQDGRQLGHLLGAALAKQPWRILRRQMPPRLGEQLIDRLWATASLYKCQRVHRHPVVALWKERLSLGGQRVQMAWPPDSAPNAACAHQTIAIEQR